MEELRGILAEIAPGVDFDAVEDLMAEKVLDSLKIVQLVTELNDAFDIEITPIDLVPENFKNINTIYSMIERLSDE